MEVALNATASDILDAIGRGFRTQADVKGKLAELYLSRELDGLLKSGVIEQYDWRDKDGLPDFGVKVFDKSLEVEVKNVRAGKAIWKDPPGFLLELQKTRNSKGGKNTRSYPITAFDIVVACLFNQSKHWRFLYVATKKLARTKLDKTLLEIYHRVPPQAEPPWRETLREAIEDCIGR
jgi:hypothetical protein